MSVLGQYRDSVTIINRTIGAGEFEDFVTVRYDGEDIELKPGENHGFPLEAVGFAKRQNKVMGTQHPLNPNKYICKVGVKGVDDCTPIPEEVLEVASHKLEVVDRSGEFWGEQMRKVKLMRKRGFDAFEAQVEGVGSNFDINSGLAGKLG